jgi:hypothetical protein
MGFELIFLTQELTMFKWQQVVRCLEASERLYLVKTERPAVNKTLSAAYAFEENIRERWPEDFYLSLETQGFYLCFYSATNQQQERITTVLASCLSQAGIAGAFEEL